MPEVMRTPVSGSEAKVRKTSNECWLQRSTLSLGSTRYGPHIAPAASDVRPGISSATTWTWCPASARTMAVVRPETPAPMTVTCSALATAKP